MKSYTSIAALAVVAALVASEPCNLQEIQGKLFPNATEGLQQCAETTGVNIWELSTFPTEEQAQAVMVDRTCVDFLNQINRVANKEIQCDVDIGGTEKDFGMLISDLLTGKTGNDTADSASSLESGSTTILPSSMDGSADEIAELPEEYDTDSGDVNSSKKPSTDDAKTPESKTDGDNSSSGLVISWVVGSAAVLAAISQN